VKAAALKSESGWRSRFANLRSMSPEAVAAIVALGVVLGVFPAPVFPTLLCALAALVLRLNPPAIQLVNYLVYPLQMALLAPFVSLGGRLFPAAAGRLTAHPAIWRAASTVWTAAAHAAAAWFCVCLPLGVLLYVVLASVLRRRGNASFQAANQTF
jgi:uncharacterized protein (DUF2062 family)